MRDALFMERDELLRLMERLSHKMSVIAPVISGGTPAFVEWHGQDLAIMEGTTFCSPTELFLPKHEALFRYFRQDGQYIFEAPEITPAMLVGIKPCDLRSVTILDRLFSEDRLYQARRSSVLIAAFNCTAPANGCNCHNMGSGPECQDSSDLVFTDLGHGYLVEAGSTSGEVTVQENIDLFREADGWCIDEKRRMISSAKVLSSCGPTPDEIREAMAGADWDEIARTCVDCGGCTFACPVCHCFNIFDLGAPDGERFRCRDSCILSGFSRMAGGHNPKKIKGERMKTWYQDKFELLPDKIGLVGCVGCARCSRACLAGIDKTMISQFKA